MVICLSGAFPQSEVTSLAPRDEEAAQLCLEGILLKGLQVQIVLSIPHLLHLITKCHHQSHIKLLVFHFKLGKMCLNLNHQQIQLGVTCHCGRASLVK